MSKKFGFFVPEMEYLEDIDGMVNYLSQKVGDSQQLVGFSLLFTMLIHYLHDNIITLTG